MSTLEGCEEMFLRAPRSASLWDRLGMWFLLVFISLLNASVDLLCGASKISAYSFPGTYIHSVYTSTVSIHDFISQNSTDTMVLVRTRSLTFDMFPKVTEQMRTRCCY